MRKQQSWWMIIKYGSLHEKAANSDALLAEVTATKKKKNNFLVKRIRGICQIVSKGCLCKAAKTRFQSQGHKGGLTGGVIWATPCIKTRTKECEAIGLWKNTDKAEIWPLILLKASFISTPTARKQELFLWQMLWPHIKKYRTSKFYNK